MACVQFLAPTIGRRLKNTDVIVVRNNTGQKAGSPTTCFAGVRPIFLAHLFTKGRNRPTSIELIPLKIGSARTGTRLTGFTQIGNCLLGEDFVPRYRGKTVAVPECGCLTRKTSSKIVKRSAWQR